jgi:hypothetical protein
MKNPGAIIVGSDDNKAMAIYAVHLAKRFEIAVPAALGQLVKLDDAMRRAADSELKMSALVIETKDIEEDPTPYCHMCGAKSAKNCDCGPIADNN